MASAAAPLVVIDYLLEGEARTIQIDEAWLAERRQWYGQQLQASFSEKDIGPEKVSRDEAPATMSVDHSAIAILN